ncbi:MAG TPA: 4-vinyl reductase [Anaerolineales bacterium]|nr:4-vinyl reductase [Anaerolineales bacterium]
MDNPTDQPIDPGKPQYFYPDRMGRVILLAMEEILGHSGVNAALNLVDLSGYINNYPPYDQDLHFPFEHISQLQAGLEAEYGPRAGRGLAVRIGRACLKYGLREFGPELGLTDLAFRLLPLQTKLKNGSEAFAALFNNFTDQRVRLERDEKYIYWQIERCPVCWERQTEAPCCHLAVGLLQEALYWVSGGKYFDVEEKKCIACGDSTCTIFINRTPIG